MLIFNAANAVYPDTSMYQVVDETEKEEGPHVHVEYHPTSESGEE